MHISDIHFRAPDCLNPALDPDRPYRTRLLQDARARVETLGPVDAILVGGDIAFKGDPREYATALGWLKELAAAVGCPLEHLYATPGNHDVDRNVITSSPSTRNAQQAVARAAPDRRERELRIQFSDPDTGRALLAPLAQYNEFAKLFSCQVYSPDHLYWTQDLELEQGVRLRLHGLTSTLLSGANGDDTRESLYLSPLQTVLDPIDDVLNLVLCHHPPDWFMDNDDVDGAICARAVIHLFGHKHRQRITREVNYIRFAAGAVNPDRYELGWQPGYNLIELHVTGSGPERALDIQAHLLQWQTDPEQFRPILTPQGEPIFRHRIAIPGHAPVGPNVEVPNPAVVPSVVAAIAEVPETVVGTETNVEAAMSDSDTRNLIFRFWNLTVSQRRQIALRLELISQDELTLAEPERYGRALLRAGERGLLDVLAREIAEVEKQ